MDESKQQQRQQQPEQGYGRPGKVKVVDTGDGNPRHSGTSRSWFHRFRARLAVHSRREERVCLPADSPTRPSPPLSRSLNPASIIHGAVRGELIAANDASLARIRATSTEKLPVGEAFEAPAPIRATAGGDGCHLVARLSTPAASFVRLAVALAVLALAAQLVARSVASRGTSAPAPPSIAVAFNLGRVSAMLQLSRLATTQGDVGLAHKLKTVIDATLERLDGALALPAGCHVLLDSIEVLAQYAQQIGDLGRLRRHFVDACARLDGG